MKLRLRFFALFLFSLSNLQAKPELVLPFGAQIGKPIEFSGASDLHFDADNTLVAMQGGWIQWSKPPLWKVYELGENPPKIQSKTLPVFAEAGDSGIRLWHRDGMTSDLPFPEGSPLREVVLAPTGKAFALIDWDDNQQNVVRIGDLTTGKIRRVLPLPASRWARNAAFSPDAKWLAVAVDYEDPVPQQAGALETNGRLHLFRVTDGKLMQTIQGFRGEIWRPAFSSDGKMLACAARDTQVRLFAFTNGQGRELFHLPFPDGETGVVAFSPDNKTFAAAGSEFLRLWNTKTGREVRSWRGHKADVNVLLWAPNGKVLVSGSEDGTTAIWNVAASTPRGQEERARLSTFDAISAEGKSIMEWLAWTPNGEFTCSTGAEKYLRWREGDILKTPAQVPHLRRDDLVTRALRGE